MHPDILFLERCAELATLANSEKQIDILNLTRPLRQILVDKHALVTMVNKKKIPLKFEICVIEDAQSDQNPFIQIMPEGIDPYVRGTTTQGVVYYAEIIPRSVSNEELQRLSKPKNKTDEKPTKLLSLPEFLANPVAIIEGAPVTVKHVIRYSAHIDGGIHYDPKPADEYKLPHAMMQWLSIKKIPGTTYMLKGITRVALRGLQPLIEDVKNR